MPASTAAATSRIDDGFSVLAAPGGQVVQLHATDKYKSVLVFWVVERELDDRRATAALLPDLLTRGTASSPGLSRMAARCEDLLAAELVAAVSGHGPFQLLRFGVQAVCDRHAGRLLFRDAVGLLAEVLHDPPLIEGRFRPDVLEQERANLVHAIEGLSDDKSLYAYRRMHEAMHAGSPRALHSWGTVELAQAVDEPALHAAWEQVRDRAPARLFIVGEVSEADALWAAGALSGSTAHDPPSVAIAPPALPAREVTRIQETQPLAQSKLAMGFRIAPELLPGAAASLFGLVFGGESHSRLFKRVREQERLAYGCSAAVSIENATLVVQAGVDDAAAVRTQELVLEELGRLARGDLGADELELSRRAQRRRILNLRDSPHGLLAFRLAGLMNGRATQLQRALDELERVRVDDVVAVAASCALDTVFLLAGRTP